MKDPAFSYNTEDGNIQAIYVLDSMPTKQLVLIFSDSTNKWFERVKQIQQLPSEVRITCMRVRDLQYCSVPDRFSLDDINLDWHLRNTTPAYSNPSFRLPEKAAISHADRLHFLLEHVAHFSRNHTILRRLAEDNRNQLWRELDHLALLLLNTTLIACGAPPLLQRHMLQNPTEVLAQFPTVLHAPILQWKEASFLNIRQKRASTSDTYYMIWTFELLLLSIRQWISSCEHQMTTTSPLDT